jgi:hypothetical protein
MKTYKIIYNSRTVKGNKFSVQSVSEKEARKVFKKDYTDLGGNWSNIEKIVSIEVLNPHENLNSWFTDKEDIKTYTVSFNGRKVGAIGIFYKIHEVVKASKNAPKNEIIKEIRMKLYDNYEHITGLKISDL